MKRGKKKQVVKSEVDEQNSLTDVERQELLDCEVKLATNQKSYIVVGEALAVINSKRLYKESHKAFDEYCVERWDFSGSHAHRLIEAFEVIRKLRAEPTSGGEDDLPCNEYQVRLLMELRKENHWVRSWKTLIKEAKKRGEKVTSKLIREMFDAKAKATPLPKAKAKVPVIKAVSPVEIEKVLTLIEDAKESLSIKSPSDWKDFLDAIEKALKASLRLE